MVSLRMLCMCTGVVAAEVETLGDVGTSVTLSGGMLWFCLDAGITGAEVEKLGDIGALVTFGQAALMFNILILKSLCHPECLIWQQ